MVNSSRIMEQITSQRSYKGWRVWVGIALIALVNVFVFVAVSHLSTPPTAYAQDGGGAEPDTKLTPIDFYPAPFEGGAMAYSLRDPWPKTDLTFYFHNCPSRIDCTAAHDAVRQAFVTWQGVSALTFQEVTRVGDADIEVTFTSSDPEGVLGTPGGVLAYNFFPRFGGDMFIDDTEPWTIGDGGDFDLLLTAIHEIGHGIGLGHSEYEDAIMYPYSGFATALGEDDITAVQELYGPPSTTPPSNTEDNTANTPIGSIDAIVGNTNSVKGTISNRSPFNIWSLNVPDNTTVTVTMYQSSGDLDPYVGIMSEDLANVIIENDNWVDNDARVVYSFEQGGTFSIVATRFGFADGDTTGTYSLTVATTQASPDEPQPEIPPTPQNITLRITNYAGTPLCYIYFSLTTESTWGPDQISGYDSLQDDYYYEWNLEAGEYDIQVWDCFDNKLEQYNVNATRSVDIQVYANRINVVPLEESVVTEEEEPTNTSSRYTWRVSNYTDTTLCAIFYSPSSEEFWGENYVAEDPLESGFYYQWTIFEESYDIRVEDCDGGYLEYYEIELNRDLEIAIFSDRIVPRDLR